MAEKKPEALEQLPSGWVRISRDGGETTHDCPQEAFDENYSKNASAEWKIVGVSKEDAEPEADESATSRPAKAKEA